MFFVFKQKSEYEKRISDWSSDVCSSDLVESAPVLVVGENTGDEGDETQDHRIKNPDGEPDGNIVGNGTDDALVSDVGGSSLLGKVVNIALVLDISNSLDTLLNYIIHGICRSVAHDSALVRLVE